MTCEKRNARSYITYIINREIRIFFPLNSPTSITPVSITVQGVLDKAAHSVH